MARWILCAAAVVAAAALPASPAATAEDWTVQDAVSAVLEDAIRPGFDRYLSAAGAMAEQTGELCASPSDETLAATRDEFKILLGAWGRVEYIRLGPLSQENRLERTLFWPDRRGRGLRQVQIAVNTEDPVVTDVAALAEQSVAVQGLLALEYVLFGTGSDDLSAAAGHRCAYAGAIAQNLLAIARDLADGWRKADGISHMWLDPSPTNPLFRDETEQLRGLLKLVSDGFEIIKAQRLDPFLGANRSDLRPKSAPFWRSGQTIPLLLANVEGLGAVSGAADFTALADEADARLVDSLAFEFRNAERALSDTLVPVEQLADDDGAYGRMAYFRVVADSIYRLSGATVAGLFGLTSGFSSLDGD